jgi:hypothetical protein
VFGPQIAMSVNDEAAMHPFSQHFRALPQQSVLYIRNPPDNAAW